LNSNTDKFLKVEVVGEFGYDQSLMGLSLNKKQPLSKMPEVALKLSDKDLGHNKYLESIYVWLRITAPRYWWQEAATYRMSTCQSESTMHTILRDGPLTQNNFSLAIPEDYLTLLNKCIEDKDLRKIKGLLPENFLQKRILVVNYKTLRNMILQRESHLLVEWQIFLYGVLSQILHPELLPVDIPRLIKKIQTFLKQEGVCE
jgi:hypothetical protein